MFTSNHIIDETLTLLARRAGYGFAAERAERIYSSQILDVVFSGRDDETEAFRLFRKFSDLQISFTDCVSFAIMKRRKIRTAFTFDRRFADAGFEVIGLE